MLPARLTMLDRVAGAMTATLALAALAVKAEYVGPGAYGQSEHKSPDPNGLKCCGSSLKPIPNAEKP